jgi:actin related protein 2/3 complex subunit 2
MTLPCYKDLLSSGVEAHLRSIYGALLVAPAAGADVTLQLDASPAPAGSSAAAAAAAAGGGRSTAELVALVSCLRLHAVGCAFDAALRSVAAKSPSAGAVICLRPREPIFVLPRPDRVAAIFALHFADATDRAVARIVCQEFVEAQRHISAAPPVNYSDREPPLELRGRAESALLRGGDEDFVGYLTLSILPRQFDTDARRANVVALLAQLRSYLDYHIKAAKANLHARMRARVDGWMQVLNRAVVEDPFAAREKKLATGKTFVRK